MYENASESKTVDKILECTPGEAQSCQIQQVSGAAVLTQICLTRRVTHRDIIGIIGRLRDKMLKLKLWGAGLKCKNSARRRK